MAVASVAALAAAVVLGLAHRLQPDELPPNADFTKIQQRRRYAGELKRTTELWASMTKAERIRRASMTTLAVGEPLDPLPEAFSWGNKDGVNFLSPMRNQHIPRYCGSCWAFAATNVLSDRWNVRQHQVNADTPFEHVPLSTQNVLSCGNQYFGVGTCHGGDDALVYSYAHEKGIPHDDCSSYIAEDMECSSTLIGRNQTSDQEARPECYSCDEKARCWAIASHKRLYSGEPYTITGEQNMMHDIFFHGPITCAIMATDKMEHEFGPGCLMAPNPGVVTARHGTGCMVGTFQEDTNDLDARINHVVEVFGWGVDADNNTYWKLRNSWGSAWGYAGTMDIVKDSNKGPLGTGNNLIETQCGAAHVNDFSFAKTNPGPGAYEARMAKTGLAATLPAVGSAPADAAQPL